MTHEEKKITKIVEELTLFFFAIGAENIKSGIRKQGKTVVIQFESDYGLDYEYRLHALDKYFSEPKNEGIEDVYWELAGSGDPGETSQLLLIGMMIDGYKIDKQEGYIKLELYKELEGLY